LCLDFVFPAWYNALRNNLLHPDAKVSVCGFCGKGAAAHLLDHIFCGCTLLSVQPQNFFVRFENDVFKSG